MKTKNLIIYIIICLIIIAGLAVWQAKGFKSELQYSTRKQIELSNYTGIEISDINAIVSEALGNTEFLIQPVETFGNSVSIMAKEITEDQRNQIVDKFNEKYKTELKSENVEIKSIPFTRIKDIVKPFIKPGIITLIAITIYFIIRFRKIGWKKVLLKTLLAPVVAELLMFSIMAITRIPLGRLTVAIGVGLYIVVIAILTTTFEKQRNAYIAELENNNQ